MSGPEAPTKIILPIGSEIRNFSGQKLNIILPDQSSLVMPLRRLHQMRPGIHDYRRAASNKILRTLSKWTNLGEPILNSYYGEATETSEEVADFELLDQIFQNRVDLYLLLNSNGGINFEMNVIRAMMEMVQKSGGQVSAYAGNRIQSAASWLFLESDQRFTLADTSLMDHTPIQTPT